jgi:hypothetical protein
MLEEAKRNGSFSRLIGIEYDAAARAHGAEIRIEMLQPHLAVDLPRPASVDVLRFSHVIEHMIDPITALRTLSPSLQPGGLVYATQAIFPILKMNAKPTSLTTAPGAKAAARTVSRSSSLQRRGRSALSKSITSVMTGSLLRTYRSSQAISLPTE